MTKPTKIVPDFSIVVELYANATIDVFRSADRMQAYCKAEGLDVAPFNTAHHSAGVGRWEPEGRLPVTLAFIPKNLPAPKVGHECLHLAIYILDGAGVKFGPNDDEQLAYLQQFIHQKMIDAKREGK